MRYHLVVTGLVQGVGFRSFVEREAKRFGLTGSVLNSGGAVHIVIRADLSAVQKFMEHIRNNAPRGSMILDISVEAKEEQRGEPGEKKEDSIDYTAGIVLSAKCGDFVKKGDPIATLYTSDPKRIAEAEKKLLDSLTFSANPPEKLPMVYQWITY